MENEDEKRKLLGQLEKALEWYRKNEDSSGMEIMVDKDVYDKAEEMAKVLNTDVEGIFAFASYRLIKREICHHARRWAANAHAGYYMFCTDFNEMFLR